MARAPEAGRAKTRLIPALGEEGAAMLHANLVEHLLGELSQAAIAPVTLCCTPDTTHPFFLHCQQAYGVQLQQQYGTDLGERLHSALSTALKVKKHALVVGCDIPLLGADDLIAALDALERGSQAAVSPTEDGGYALLGISEPAPELFCTIDWGSERVMSQTRDKLTAMQWSCTELRQQWDVDRPEDLQRLRELNLSPQLTELLMPLD